MNRDDSQAMGLATPIGHGQRLRLVLRFSYLQLWRWVGSGDGYPMELRLSPATSVMLARQVSCCANSERKLRLVVPESPVSHHLPRKLRSHLRRQLTARLANNCKKNSGHRLYSLRRQI